MDRNDFVLTPETIAHLSGLDILRQMVAGTLPCPPIAESLNFVFGEVEPGNVTFKAQPDFKFYNALNCVHGGYIATLLDTAMACSVQSRLPAGKNFTTLEFKVNFVRPVYEHTGIVTAVGSLIHLGRTTASAEGKLYDERGKLYAFATTTCAIFPLKVQDTPLG